MQHALRSCPPQGIKKTIWPVCSHYDQICGDIPGGFENNFRRLTLCPKPIPAPASIIWYPNAWCIATNMEQGDRARRQLQFANQVGGNFHGGVGGGVKLGRDPDVL